MEKEIEGKTYTLYGSSDDSIYEHFNVTQHEGTNLKGKYTFNNKRAIKNAAIQNRRREKNI